MNIRKMILANFNIVFGKNEEPLLNYFDTIILPAFKSNFIHIVGDTEYKFMKVRLIDIKDVSLALTGIIIKNTTIEIRSKLDERGNLIETDETYPTAPYSTFIIYLKNHRMTLVKNQKGSPNLKTFSSTFTKMLNKYVRTENPIREVKELPPYPMPIVNIVGIPIKESIEEALRKVKKINKLTLRFYPLNGDLDYSRILNGFSTDVRKLVDSKTGSLILNSPQSIDGVIEVIHAAQGTVDPIFNVTYPDKSKGIISNDMLSENLDINIDDTGETKSETEQIVQRMQDFENLSYVSEENENIYNKNIDKITPLIE